MMEQGGLWTKALPRKRVPSENERDEAHRLVLCGESEKRQHSVRVGGDGGFPTRLHERTKEEEKLALAYMQVLPIDPLNSLHC